LWLGLCLFSTLGWELAYPDVSKCYIIRVFAVQILRLGSDSKNGQDQSEDAVLEDTDPIILQYLALSPEYSNPTVVHKGKHYTG